MLYSNFSEFSKDQERLISINGREQKGALDYLEGLLLMHDGPPDNWRSSFFPISHHSTIISLVNQHSIIYCLEVAKYYDDRSRDTVDKVRIAIVIVVSLISTRTQIRVSQNNSNIYIYI